MIDILYNGEIFKSTGIRNYYVSESGKVGNAKFKDGSFVGMYILRTEISKNGGYIRVPLKYELGKERKYLVHRLVYQSFVDKLIDGLVIDHIDGNQLNNNYKNLRQCTQKENINNALNHGFGNNNSKQIFVKELSSGKILKFDKIKDLIQYTQIPIANGSLAKLKKHTKFKLNYIIIENSEQGQQTIESIV